MLLGLVAATCMMLAGQVISQETAPRRGGGPGGAGGPGGPGGERQRMTRIRESLAVSDDQWKILEPKIEKIDTLRRDAEGPMMGGRPMGPRAESPASAPASAPALSDAQQKAAALRDVLSKSDATDAQIKTALKALRDARSHAHKELATARKDLLKSVDQKQEARLVLWSVLE
jgi:hypothetical protein